MPIEPPLPYKVTFPGSGDCNLSVGASGQLNTLALLIKVKMAQCLPKELGIHFATKPLNVHSET